jgi:hypothetical protein
MSGLELIWPQLILVLGICWLEIRFSNRRADLYYTLNGMHKEHIAFMIESMSFRDRMIRMLIKALKEAEQKDPPTVG